MTHDEFLKLSDQAKWDQYALLLSENESLRQQNRPQEGNAILRIDLQLPVEQIAEITKQQALRVSIETV